MKVKFGLGANFLAIKKRNLNDISTFIDHETEVVNEASLNLKIGNENKNFQEATKEDQMDLEGKCMRKKVFLQTSNPPNVSITFRPTNDISDAVVCESVVQRGGTDSNRLDSPDLKLFLNDTV